MVKGVCSKKEVKTMAFEKCGTKDTKKGTKKGGKGGCK